MSTYTHIEQRMLGQKSKDFRKATSAKAPQETLLELSQKILSVLKDTKAILNFDRCRDTEDLNALLIRCTTLSDEQIKEEAQQFGKACTDKARAALAINRRSTTSPAPLRSILGRAASRARVVARIVPRLLVRSIQDDDVVTPNTPNQKQGLLKAGWDALKRSIVGVG